MCNLKGTTYNDKLRENNHSTLQFSLSSIELYSSFQLIVLVVWPATVLIHLLLVLATSPHYTLPAEHQTAHTQLGTNC